MRPFPANSARKGEQGLIITLVAIFMLGVVGAMAALAIDVVTFYAARSEAQLAADGAALAGARVLANSGMTSDSGLAASAKSLCEITAPLVAESNQVGGQSIAAGQVTVNCNITNDNDPTATVKVQATLPTFFARIWGTTQVTVSASATAEAYNPSNAGVGSFPVAASCVKPLLLSNTDPNGTTLFDPTTGAILDNGLLGKQVTLSSPLGTGTWQFSTGDTFNATPPSFPPPLAASITNSVPACTGASLNTFQRAVAGCVQIPIACNNNTTIFTDTAAMYNGQYGTTVDPDTVTAVNCLTNSTASDGDSVFGYPTSNPPAAPFEFVAGADNPIVQAGALSSGKQVLISDSLATLPVYTVPGTSTTSATLVGFVQLFLNPNGNVAPYPGPAPPSPGGILATVVNLVGCGTNASGTPPIYGNGPSPVAVRLITPP